MKRSEATKRCEYSGRRDVSLVANTPRSRRSSWAYYGMLTNSNVSLNAVRRRTASYAALNKVSRGGRGRRKGEPHMSVEALRVTSKIR